MPSVICLVFLAEPSLICLFHVAAVAKAEELVKEGKIGNVKQTIGTGPHRQGNYERPDWFYDRESYGGIITDIGSHQIHQLLEEKKEHMQNYCLDLLQKGLFESELTKK